MNELLAFVCMVAIVSLFLAGIVVYGRWVERRATPATPPVMSHPPAPPAPASGMGAVHIPVSGMDTGAAGMADMPDIDAEKPSDEEDDITPRVSSHLSDQEFFVFLVMQRNASGYRLSANKIAQLVGGDRNDVLARIKALRATPAPPRYQELDEQHRPVGLAPKG